MHRTPLLPHGLTAHLSRTHVPLTAGLNPPAQLHLALPSSTLHTLLMPQGLGLHGLTHTPLTFTKPGWQLHTAPLSSALQLELGPQGDGSQGFLQVPSMSLKPTLHLHLAWPSSGLQAPLGPHGEGSQGLTHTPLTAVRPGRHLHRAAQSSTLQLAWAPQGPYVVQAGVSCGQGTHREGRGLRLRTHSCRRLQHVRIRALCAVLRFPAGKVHVGLSRDLACPGACHLGVPHQGPYCAFLFRLAGNRTEKGYNVSRASIQWQRRSKNWTRCVRTNAAVRLPTDEAGQAHTRSLLVIYLAG